MATKEPGRLFNVTVESSGFSADWIDNVFVFARSVAEAEALATAHIQGMRAIDEVKYAIAYGWEGPSAAIGIVDLAAIMAEVPA